MLQLSINLSSVFIYVTFFSFPVIFSTVFIVFQLSIYRFSVVYLSVLRCSVTYLLHLSFHVPIFYLSVIPFPVIFSSFFSVPAVNLSDLLFLPSIYHLSVFLPCMANGHVIYLSVIPCSCHLTCMSAHESNLLPACLLTILSVEVQLFAKGN